MMADNLNQVNTPPNAALTDLWRPVMIFIEVHFCPLSSITMESSEAVRQKFYLVTPKFFFVQKHSIFA